MLIGNVGQEPEVRYVEQGVAVARLRLATTERGYTLQNGTQVDDWQRLLRNMFTKVTNSILKVVSAILHMTTNRVSADMPQKSGQTIWKC